MALSKQKCFYLVLKSSTAIITWLKRRAGPTADLITDVSQLESLTAEDELVVLGLFKVISLAPLVVVFDFFFILLQSLIVLSMCVCVFLCVCAILCVFRMLRWA